MNRLKQLFPFIILFILFLIIFFLSPISGDDWGNYLVGSTGLYHSIGNAIGMYFDWEGRFISRILINILTYHKILWNFLNSLVIVLIIYYMLKIIKPKNKNLILLLSILTILLMNIYTFSQIVVWIAGNITYLFQIPLLLFVFYKVLYNKDYSNKTIILITFLNFIIPMFVEHVAVILVVFNILINIYSFIKTKKLNKKYLIYLTFSIIGLLLMFFSPGSLKRSGVENLEFKELSLFGKIFYNIPNYIYYTFFINTFMNILMCIANYYLINKNVKNKLLRIGAYLYLTLPVLLVTASYLISFLFNTQQFLYINQNNIFIILYFISYALIDLILIFITFDNNEINIKLLFYILGHLGNCVMLLSPTWGYRTSFLTYLLLSISYIMIIDHFYKENKIINKFLVVILSLVSIFYITLYVNVHKAEIAREKSIRNQMNKTDVIEIEKMPYFVNCNINPDNEFHLLKFKQYYHIKQDAEIKLVEGNWKYKIFYKEKIKK